MSEEGAFDEVVKGADAIAHVAFPMFVKWGWVKEVLEPAIKGATGLPRVRSNMVNWSSASCTPPEKLYDPRLVSKEAGPPPSRHIVISRRLRNKVRGNS